MYREKPGREATYKILCRKTRREQREKKPILQCFEITRLKREEIKLTFENINRRINFTSINFSRIAKSHKNIWFFFSEFLNYRIIFLKKAQRLRCAVLNHQNVHQYVELHRTINIMINNIFIWSIDFRWNYILQLYFNFLVLAFNTIMSNGWQIEAIFGAVKSCM